MNQPIPPKHRLSVSIKDEEGIRLFNAWKRAEGVRNCSEFVKRAINAYAGEQIFSVQETKV